MNYWEFVVPWSAITELEESFNFGPIIDNKVRRSIDERKVDSIRNLKISVYSNEHPPPHFIVTCSEGSRRFQISDCSPLEGKELDKYIRNIKEWHKKNKNLLIETWNTSRPSDCTVGEYRE